MSETLWKITCQEITFPGMWRHWYRNQCVAVGWPKEKGGYKLEEPSERKDGWPSARNRLKEMKIGDKVIVALAGNRVGRIGAITGKAIGDDDWNPLVPPRPGLEVGDVGRRVQVRWDLTVGPDNQDLVVQLPEDCRLSQGELRRTITRVQSISLEKLIEVMNDASNWVSLLGKFRYERALSDYIANYPNHLEDGLLPHPDSKVRERVFKDRTRLDVLLIDQNNNPVIVECKQHAPTEHDIQQLRHYMALLEKETDKSPRGILVHGGAQKLVKSVVRQAKEEKVEIVSYKLDVDFRPSRL